MSLTGKIWTTIFLVMILAILIPPVRSLVSHILTTYISPLIKEILKAFALWIWAFTKGIWRYHAIIIRNLCTPRNVLFKSLTKENDEK